MSVAMNGQRITVPCVPTLSYLDPGGPKRTPNCSTNVHGGPGQYQPHMVQPIDGMVWHTIHGTATGEFAPDAACAHAVNVRAVIEDFARPSRKASATFVIEATGLVYNLLDLVTDRSWSACEVNPFTLSVEQSEFNNRTMCRRTVLSGVRLAWWVCARFGIQPMIPFRNGDIDFADIPDWKGSGAKAFRGHYFHANVPTADPKCERGKGDPGPAFGRAFLASGAEGFDVRAGQDRDVWRARQASLGMPAAMQDGIPGLDTVAAMRTKLGRSTWRIPTGAVTNCAGGGGGGGSWLLPLLAAGLAWRAVG